MRSRRNRYVTITIVMVGLAIFLSASVLGQIQVQVVAVGKTPLKRNSDDARLVKVDKNGKIEIPLVEVDEQVSKYLEQAREMIQKKDYASAIEILQALLNCPKQCYVATSDGHRFVSIAYKAMEIISTLPADAMALYRRLYDPTAKRMFNLAAERLDESILRDITVRYLYTSYGDDALNLLGAILFDRGEFTQAAECWQRVLRLRRKGSRIEKDKLNEAVLLSKIAVASYLAGDTDTAEKMLKLLRRQFSDARAKLAGKEQNVFEYTQRLLEGCSFEVGLKRRKDWPCLAGAPDSVAASGSCRPVLAPVWKVPSVPLSENPNVRVAISRLSHITGRMTSSDSLRYSEGRLCLIKRVRNSKRAITIPPLIHPIVVNSVVIYRGSDGIYAHDLLTGEELWQSVEFPLFRRISYPGGRVYYLHRVGISSDDGLWTLTAGEGLVFAIGEITSSMVKRPFVGAVRGRNHIGAKGSVLAAFSIEQQGRIVWKLGRGRGPTEAIRLGRFLTAPTYADGRVYAITEYLQGFYLLCIDAKTGNLIWSNMISQVPVEFSRSQRFLEVPGNPPAVANGKVFVATNGGIIAAFDAHTGAALWAYQYKPVLQHPYPFNPVVVASGNVIALPVDSEQILALGANDGRLVWSVPRDGLQYLAAIDSARVVLTGGSGIEILNASTGKTVWSNRAISGLYGRPAITTDSIIVSGIGEIVTVSLNDFSVLRPPLLSPNGSLGNLICVDDKLISADAAGVSVYVAFEEAYKELTERISKASPDELPELYYHRALNAFIARRPHQALTDLFKVQKCLSGKDAPVLRAKTQYLLYRTYVSLANSSSDDAKMLKYFLKAQKYAYSDRSKGEMLVRLMKYYEKIGRADIAAVYAQELSDKFGQVELADRKIGPSADPFVHDSPNIPLITGYELGQQFIARLIERYGQRCYAAIDAKAQKELYGAIAAGNIDAILEVSRKYPHSLYAPTALFKAAEAYYRRSLQLSGTNQRKLLRRAGICLYQIVRKYPRNRLIPSVYLGLALVYGRINPAAMDIGLRGLERAQGDVKVSFADVTGRASEMLSRLARTRVSILQRRPIGYIAGKINLPVKRLFASPADSRGEGAMVLRDSAAQAIRYGKDIFLIKAGQIIRFDPSAASFEEGIKWETPRVIDRSFFHGRYIAHTPQAVLTSDSKILTVATSVGSAGVDVKTGKVLWQRSRTSQYIRFLTTSEERVVAITAQRNVYVSDTRTGKQLLSHRLSSRENIWIIPPQIADGLLLLCTTSGRKKIANIFGIDMGNSLPRFISISNEAILSAHLSPCGLLLIKTNKSLKIIEPVLGVELWNMVVSSSPSLTVVGLTDRYLFISSAEKPGTLLMRDIAQQGLIVRTFRLSPTGSKPSYPAALNFVGHHLYVVASSAFRASAWDREPLKGRIASCLEPTLHAFDVDTGKELWSVSLTPPGATRRRHYLVMPMQVGKSHISILVKDPSNIRHPQATAMLINRSDGKISQYLKISDASGLNSRSRYTRQMMLFPPVMVNGRVVVETYKGVEIYGRVEK